MAYYKRPFCPMCNLIWGKNAIGKIVKCTKCGLSLDLKNFNPFISASIGLLIILLGLTTFLIKDFPVFWIGGLIFGLAMIINGFSQWQKIKELDGEQTVTLRSIIIGKIRKIWRAFKYRNYIVASCMKCGQKLRYPKKRIRVTCPKCKYSFLYVPQ